ncbi:MAG: sugar phosphate nucleotidyltransferase [bacterium]
MKKIPVESKNSVDSELIREAQEKSKSMLGVGENHRPFLDYLLYNAFKAGYKDVVIVVGENDASIQSYYGSKFRNNNFMDLCISYALQTIPEGREKPLGTADALLQALKFRTDWQGKKFTVCNSDNLYSTKAFRLLADDPHPNSFIDYDRSALKFKKERIKKFAVTKKDANGFLEDIIEKPSYEDIESVKNSDNKVGVSMNIFRFSYDMILPFLKKVPINPKRHEKELPEAVMLMTRAHPQTCYAILLEEHVPDLTSCRDIEQVRKYLTIDFDDLI